MRSRFEVFSLRFWGLGPFLAVTLLSVLLSGCGGGSSVPVNIHGDGTSGVRGTAIYFVSSTNTTAPLPNAIITVQTTFPHAQGQRPNIFGPVVAQTQTDAQGNYSIALAPGYYGIGGQAAEPNNSHTQINSVYIPARQYIQVKLGFSTPRPPTP